MTTVKCPRCGAEVEAQKFCIQCGERLIPKESSVRIQKTSHTPSGVMRFRHRSALSQSSLPVVSNRQNRNNNMNLASLQSAPTPQSAPVIEKPKKIEPVESVRQSRELEALLLKLNGSEADEDRLNVRSESENDINISNDVSEPFDSLQVDMSSEYDSDANVSFDNSFFLEKNEHVSGPLPVGSGSFARVPSGGFHLVVDSIKSACKNTAARIRKTFSRNPNETADDRKRRNQFIAIAVVAAIVTLIIGVAISGSDDAQQPQTEIAAQTPIGGNETFDILPIEEEEQDITNLKFDADDFSIPDLEFAFDDEADPESEVFIDKPADKKPSIELAKAQAKLAAETAAGIKTTNEIKAETTPTPAAIVAANKPTEAKLYGRNDNVLGIDTAGESYKTKRSCVMREGPASRFGMVKEVATGTTIKILANTEEDWELQTGGVWTKAGQPSKLGPGTNFADAGKGMSLPQPKSRVISSNNWRYIQVGKVYGYVGPACFK